ncbi:MAG: dephospho-CoA kinase [Bacteroidetes bacterium 4572_117]|nr:MAG: dephospho-CoA kinase [Bacteroidetes bacterium 4572_117]
MIKIGLTGGIGSGKSYVSSIFEALGIPVYNSDIEAKKLYYLDDVKSEMVDFFGKQVYFDSGEINKELLAKLVFSNKKALNKINEIIHPRVKTHFSEWLLSHHAVKYIVKEAAILFESGAYKQTDKIIVVTAPEELRIKRVLAREKIHESLIRKKIANQMAQSEMVARSCFVIINDEKHALLPQVDKIHHTILSHKPRNNNQ